MSYKYFGTDGVRGKVGSNLINPEFVLKLGWALGSVIRNGAGSKVLIGKDTRISGYMLESALEAGLSAAGVDIHLMGPMPTPAVAYLTRTYRAQAGIVISASHNPYDDNGIKFFSENGFKFSDDVQHALEKKLDEDMVLVSSNELGRAHRIEDAAGRYIEFCKSTVPSHFILSGMKIVVDCANGATYHVAPDIFRELGATVLEVGCAPDGLNINNYVGATHPEIMQQKVKEAQADFGVAFDGDGDRVIMIDEKGDIVNGDELLFIMAMHRFENNALNGGVIGTVMTNLGFENTLKQKGIPFKRTKVGDRFVMQALREENWELGGESSGHIVNLGLTTTGDGIISALQVLCAMSQTGKTLHELKSGMQKYPQTLINVPVKVKINTDEHKDVKAAVSDAEQSLADRGRVLLRASGTEPVVRVMVEGEDAGEVSNVAKSLAEVVRGIA